MFSSRYSQLRMITPKAIHDTLLYDGQTRLWFLKLCFLPEVEAQLRGSCPSAGANYNRYRVLSLTALFLMISAAVFLVSAALSPRTSALKFTAAGIFASGAAMVALIKRRGPLAALAEEFVRLNASAIPPGMTLYQMGEVFARTYRVPSLVDMIWQWDLCLKNAFLLIYAAAFGVFFLPFWKMVLVTCLGCGVAVLVLKAMIMAQKSKPVGLQADK